MKKTVKIGKTILGKGLPKICIPIMGRTEEEILAQTDKLVTDYIHVIDVAELRIDFYEGVTDSEKLKALLINVKKHIKDIPVLCTFRSKSEGGELEVSVEEYRDISRCAIESMSIDAIDVEIFSKRDVYEEIKEYAHSKSIPVVASNHSFSMTPDTKEITDKLCKMSELGADVAKIAVMPKDFYDVLRLMEAAKKADEKVDVPIIAISMGELGAITRVAGNTFGSVLTFGIADKASAPGQMEAGKLSEAISLLG